jgi:hypothetical protein
MSIITKPNNIQKGVTATLTLSKSALAQLPMVAADAYFQDMQNWFRVSVIYKSSTGRQYETVEFDAQQQTPTGNFLVSGRALDQFQVLSVEIIDFDGGILRIPRAVLNTGDFDIQL